MADFKTPGVYVTERDAFGSSVVQVPTAVPAFIGCTAKGPARDAAGVVVPNVVRIDDLGELEMQCGGPRPSWFTVAADGAVTRLTPTFDYVLYECLRLFFANGGQACYVVSVGNYDHVPTKADFEAGLAALAVEDEPTLILLTEAIHLPPSDYYALARLALAQCSQRRDRFTILDVIDDRGVAEFRDNIGDDNLMWGAAYYPFLRTTLTYAYTGESVALEARGITLADVQDPQLHNKVTEALAHQFITMPSSPAVAGVYAQVDQDRGVWVASSNVSLSLVTGPTVALSVVDQGSLEYTPDGKSINAIRAFPAGGTMVWGTRTLAGNDPEWRYIPVRRLMNTIEASVTASTAFVEFQPNGADTWRTVTAMVENYLRGLWIQGAMAGATERDAYFVKVGLGDSMTQQDIADGRLIIELGVAAVNPTDFIIVRITRKVAPG